jgi:predicted transcriptional regulator
LNNLILYITRYYKYLLPSSIHSITRVNSSLKDLFIYLYNLSPLEIDLLIFLIKKENKTNSLDDLTLSMNKDRSTVFRALQKLVNAGICVKETKTLKEGGIYHVYSALPKEMFRSETEKKVKELEESLHRILKKFEKDLEGMIDSFYSEKRS